MTGFHFLGDTEPKRRGISRLGARSLVAWVALLVVSSVGVVQLFPRAFSAAPSGSWRVSREEAVAIAKERIYDLGEMPQHAYVAAKLESKELLELHFLATMQGLQSEGQPGPDGGLETLEALQRRLLVWSVTVYDPGSGSADWRYRGEVAASGEVLTLLRGVDPGFSSPVRLTSEDAVSRADAFLQSAGFDLSEFFDPVERRIEVSDFSYLLLRYQNRESMNPRLSAGEQAGLAASPSHGVEVRFAGGDLLGFLSWEDQALGRDFTAEVRAGNQIQFARFLVVFLLLPLVVLVFVRRYHQGLVGARRGAQVFALVLGCSAAVLALTARSASEGMDFGDFDRAKVTVGWIGILLLIYFPAVALLAGTSCAVGESLAHGTWRSRWVSLDALLTGRWANATVGASSLRGVAAGMVLLGLLLGGVLVLSGLGVLAPFSLVLGPWWSSAEWPGLTLLLLQVAFSSAGLCFALLFLLPLLAGWLGVVVSGLVASLVMATLFFSPVATVPALAGFPLVLLFSAAIVVLFLRYDFVTAWLANLVGVVGAGALALIEANDVSLQVQGAGVLLAAAAPLIVSLPHTLGSRFYRYEYDDVPSHVRLIAERERQRVELETARGIQTSILPDLPSELIGIEIANTYVPTSEVGGDFYDVIELEDGRLAIAIGDVAGHGVSSGLIMSMVRSALALQVSFRPEVEEVMTALNQVVYQSAKRRLLTTLCYALYDPASGNLSYASAGHLYPYRISPSGLVSVLESSAYPLGVRKCVEIDRRETTLMPGDALFLASDGLVEARRYGGEEMFGFDRLEESLRSLGGRDAEGIRAGMMENLEHFICSGRGQGHAGVAADDDLTLLVVRIPPSPVG